MNGDELTLEPAATGAFIPQPSGGIFSDFFGAAQQKVTDLTDRFRTLPTSPQSSVGGSIFEALYQFGRGRVDVARERAATALLQSKTGQRFVGEVERQRIQQWLPYIIGGALLLIFIGVFVGRR